MFDFSALGGEGGGFNPFNLEAGTRQKILNAMLTAQSGNSHWSSPIANMALAVAAGKVGSEVDATKAKKKKEGSAALVEAMGLPAGYANLDSETLGKIAEKRGVFNESRERVSALKAQGRYQEAALVEAGLQLSAKDDAANRVDLEKHRTASGGDILAEKGRMARHNTASAADMLTESGRMQRHDRASAADTLRAAVSEANNIRSTDATRYGTDVRARTAQESLAETVRNNDLTFRQNASELEDLSRHRKGQREIQGRSLDNVRGAMLQAALADGTISPEEQAQLQATRGVGRAETGRGTLSPSEIAKNNQTRAARAFFDTLPDSAENLSEALMMHPEKAAMAQRSLLGADDPDLSRYMGVEGSPAPAPSPAPALSSPTTPAATSAPGGSGVQALSDQLGAMFGAYAAPIMKPGPTMGAELPRTSDGSPDIERMAVGQTFRMMAVDGNLYRYTKNADGTITKEKD